MSNTCQRDHLRQDGRSAGQAPPSSDPAAGPGGRRVSGTTPAQLRLFSSTWALGQVALEKMLARQSSRRYAAGLEPAE